MRRSLPVIWLAQTPNLKTGNVPTGYVGTTLAEVRSSCVGCPLLDGDCYAWAGHARGAMMRHEERYHQEPERFSVDSVLKRRRKTARIARLGAMGDPAHAERDGLWGDLDKLRSADLQVVSYSHFWREDYAQDLRDVCMASCETAEDAENAIAMGWKPSLILPWDHYMTSGRRFYLNDGHDEGIVCPAQLKPGAVTCNDCRLCCVSHPVWKAGRLKAIGFLDHSRRARREKRRFDPKQLPLFGRS